MGVRIHLERNTNRRSYWVCDISCRAWPEPHLVFVLLLCGGGGDL
jgi:hypothetical protein